MWFNMGLDTQVLEVQEWAISLRSYNGPTV